MEIDSIPIFKPQAVLEFKDDRITSVDFVTKKSFVVGDSKGNVTMYQINGDRASSAVVEEIKLGKSKVTKVAALGAGNLMVAAIMDSNLYLVDFTGKKQPELILKGAINFYYWQGENTVPKFLVISKGNKSNMHAYKLNFDAQSLAKVFDLQKVG